MQEWFIQNACLLIIIGVYAVAIFLIGTRNPIKTDITELREIEKSKLTILDINLPIQAITPKESKLFLVEEVLWGNTDNVYTRSILQRFDSKEARQEYLNGLKNYKFAYQHTIKCWDAKLSDIQPDQIKEK